MFTPEPYEEDLEDTEPDKTAHEVADDIDTDTSED